MIVALAVCWDVSLVQNGHSQLLFLSSHFFSGSSLLIFILHLCPSFFHSDYTTTPVIIMRLFILIFFILSSFFAADVLPSTAAAAAAFIVTVVVLWWWRWLDLFPTYPHCPTSTLLIPTSSVFLLFSTHTHTVFLSLSLLSLHSQCLLITFISI